MRGRTLLRQTAKALGLAIPVVAVAFVTSGPAYSSGDARAVAEQVLSDLSSSECTVVADVTIAPTASETVAKAAAGRQAERWIEDRAIWLGSVQGAASDLRGRIVSGDANTQWVLIEGGPAPQVQQFIRLELPDQREVWLRADSVAAVPVKECTEPTVDF